MQKILKASILAVVAAFSVSAHAITENLDTNGLKNTLANGVLSFDSGSNSVAGVVGVLAPTFTDYLTFTLPTSLNWELNGDVDASGKWQTGFLGFLSASGFSKVSLDLQVKQSNSWVSIWTGSDLSLSASDPIKISFDNLLTRGGNFQAVVSGTYRDAVWTENPTYDFAVTAAPVPEPESYAMLLAGLGLMGGIARRRKQK